MARPRADMPLVLDRGDALTLHLPEGQRYSGKLLSVMLGELSLELRTRQVVTVPLEDVEKLDLEKRWLLQGALIGGGVGGLIGVLGGSYVCLLESSVGPVNMGECAGTGLLVGGAIGAGLGLVAGLANIHWDTVYERDKQGPLSVSMEEPGVIERWFSHVGHRGEFSLTLGSAAELSGSRVTIGYGGRVQALMQLGSHVALGPELALYNNIGDRENSLGYMDQLGGVLRGSMQLGSTRASLLLGLGQHENRSSHLGGSVGAEVEMRPWPNAPPLAFEARYLLQLDDSGFGPRQQFLTIGLGPRLRF
jgi:hypothetical protein